MKAKVALSILLALALLVSYSCTQKPAPQTREKVDLIMYGSTAGGAAYIATAGLAELMNKYHPWLRGTVMESFGASATMMALENPTTMGSGADSAYWTALEGGKPFEKKHTNLRIIGINQLCGFGIISVNPKIKTKADLVGKRIAVGNRAGSISSSSEFLIGDMWGMWDKIKPDFIQWKEGGEALKSGTIDAMSVVVSLSVDDAGKPIWADHPSFSELVALRDIFFIGPTEAEVAAGAKKKGWPVSYMPILAKALGAHQPDAGSLVSMTNSYLADVSMTDEVAYEIMKLQYDYYKEWGAYHAGLKIITPKTLGVAPAKTEAEFHPGALKFLKEKKVPIYVGGASPPLN